MSQRKIGLILFAGTVLGFGMAAAGGAQTAPAPTPVSAPAAADDAMRATFERTCSACHELQQATSQQRDLAAWQETIVKMVGYGADVPPEQVDPLAHYLAAHYGLPPKK